MLISITIMLHCSSSPSAPLLPNPSLIVPTKILLPPNPSRRHFAAASSSLLLLHLIAPVPARPETLTTNTADCAATNPTPTKQAFLDVSIDGEPIGRIVIGLYGDAFPAGASRFSDLVSGAAGITYRRKDFIKIMPNYIQHGGVRSYGVDAELARKARGSNGLDADRLVDEWKKQDECSKGYARNVARSVSIIVRNPAKPPPKPKLVARGGKLEIDQEEIGTEPNGTEFVITVKDSPELDSSALVVGKVLQGMDVVNRIEQVKTVAENTTSPYFRY